MARKRKTPKGFDTITGRTLTENYCTICERNLHPEKFYQALDIYIHKNGLSSICKECHLTLYNDLQKEMRSIPDTLEKYAQIVNYPFNESIAFEIKENIENDGKRSAIAQYNQRIKVLYKDRDLSGTKPDLRLSFSEETIRKYRTDLDGDANVDNEFWGDGYSPDEIEYLEKEYKRAREGIKVESYTQTKLLKRISKKSLAMRRAEEADGDNTKLVGQLEKEFLLLLKSMGISPSDVKKKKSAQQKFSIGNIVRIIETSLPGEFIEEEKEYGIYDDILNIGSLYVENHITRPIRNLISGKVDSITYDDNGKEIPPPF